MPNTLGLQEEILSHFHNSRELDGTLYGQGQFICIVTGLHLPHLDHKLESLPSETKMTIGLALEHMRVDKYIGELPPTSFSYLAVPMTLVRKMVGDHEALRYRRQDMMVKIWKHDLAIRQELLDVEPTWESTGSFEDPHAYHWELLPFSSFHPVFYVATIKKKVGDRESLQYPQRKRGRCRRHGWQMDAQWKDGLPKEATEDDQKIKLLCYHFLGDKEIFEGGEIDEDPPPRRNQRIVQAHELESEARRLARDWSTRTMRPLTRTTRLRRWPSQLGQSCRMAHMCTWCISYAM